MIIAFTTKGANWESEIDPRFGRTEYFLIYDEEKDNLTSYDNTGISDVSHGAGPRTVQKLLEFKPDILITGNGPGGNAGYALARTGIKIYYGALNMTAKQAYEKFKNNELDQFSV